MPSDMVAAYQKSFDHLKKEQSKFETALESSMTVEQSEAWSQRMTGIFQGFKAGIYSELKKTLK